MKPGKPAPAALLTRKLTRLLPALFLLLSLPVGKSAAHSTHHKVAAQADLRVATQGWGKTSQADLNAVLQSVATAFGRHFPSRKLDPIVVTPDDGGPVVLYERAPDDAYVVRLSARDGRWFQFVYQFSHELCHIYSNFDNKMDKNGKIADFNQWFEESVCEAASLYTLRALSQQWAAAPADSVFARHAANLRAYAEYFIQERHRQLPKTKSLALWYQVNNHHLARNPYHRKRNELVANILLEYFESKPSNWEAIAYLNPDPEGANLIFEQYLVAWHDACPEELKGIVEQIIARFEQQPPSVQVANTLPAPKP